MSTARRRGKDLERYVARTNGGQRTGQYGGADVDAGLFSIEAKSHQSEPPQWLMAALAQARRHARPDQVPVAVHQYSLGKGRPRVTVYVLDEEAWFDLHGPVEVESESD